MTQPSSSEPTPRTPERVVLFAGVLLIVALTVVVAAKVLLVIFAGILLAIWLRTSAEFVARLTRLPVWLTLGSLVLAGLGGMAAMIVLVAPRWSEQVSLLNRQLPAMMDRLNAYWQSAPIVGPSTGQAVDTLEGDAKTVARALVSAAGTSVQIAAALVILVFVCIYGAAQPGMYVRTFLAVTPRPYRERMRRILRQVKADLTRWLLGRVVAMVIVGVTTTVSFSLLDLPLAGMLGVISGLFTFVEYLGAMTSIIPPLLLALAKSPATALWVLLVFTLLHVMEGYLLTPLLVRTTVRFPPAVTLGCQALLGVLLGPLGLTLSTSLLVVAVAANKAWHADAG